MPRSQSRAAKRMYKKRHQESQEETADRLAANKEAKLRRREESPKTSQRRLADKRAHQVSYRDLEDDRLRRERLEHVRQHNALARHNEPPDHRADRLEQVRQHNALARENEPADDRVIRLHHDRVRHNDANAQGRNRVRNRIRNIAFDYDPEETYPDVSNIGRMDNICVYCNALKFRNETKGVCCNSGKVVTEAFPELPRFLQDLISGDTERSTHFLDNIRQYNGSFCMTSFGHREAIVPGWNPSFIVQGQVFHRIGTLLPPVDTRAMFLQVYFLDSLAEQVQTRQFGQLRPDILQELTEWFMANNHLVRSLKTAKENIEETVAENRKIVISEDKRPVGQHPRRYNAQNAPEVAILMENEPTNDRDIVIRLRNGSLQRISELHPSYDPMQYPIAFPYGTDGYSIYLQGRGAGGRGPGRKITQMQYYSYHIQVREGNYLLKLRRLLQYILVDAYCKIETSNLRFLQYEQKALRADNYANLHDNLIANDGDPDNVGQRIVLPATFTGGPRWMHARQADAMAYVRRMGRPQFFITMTTNPKWQEIVDNLYQGQQSHDRPDLIAKVFNLKLKALMAVLNNGAFGEVQAFIYTVEQQKRGLPHAHILEWITPEDKVRPDDIDRVISAEIPDFESCPELYSLVMTHMVHGPCGDFNKRLPCMKEDKRDPDKLKCCHKFPKDFVQYTEQGNDSYPKYRRLAPENDGHVGIKEVRQHGKQVSQEIDNRWIVPYNPFLLLAFKCHINVELCSSIKCIKYITKYITKGSDQAVFQLQAAEGRNINEIEEYQNARYVGASEAAGRIRGDKISDHFPPVVSLSVHLENGQRIIFPEGDARQAAEAPPPSTTLTAFFALCAQDPFAKTLKYQQVPEFYTWQKGTKCWQRRKRGAKVDGEDEVVKCSAIGRIHTISPKLSDCYFVRMLLTDVVGPTSFNDLRTVDGEELSYREACMARGLLRDDNHLNNAMEEALFSQSPRSLRKLFALILTACEPSEPFRLWEEYKEYLAEDVLFTHKEKTGDQDALFTEAIFNQTLCYLEDEVLLLDDGKRLLDFDLPAPNRDIAEDIIVPAENLEQLASEADAAEATFTDEQRAVYQLVLDMANDPDTYHEKNIVFLDAPGGTGKTFMINSILKRIRSHGKEAIATATSGIAATLLEKGATLHSAFAIPIDCHLQNQPTCKINRGSAMARTVSQCALIVVDEAPMAHKSNYEALDRTLRDLREPNQPMGGIPVLLCGDFRQLLPVIKGGTRSNIVNGCLNKSHLWKHVTVKHLTKNMRAYLTGNDGAKTFSDLLLTIGNGTFATSDGHDMVNIPDGLGHVVANMEEMKLRVFPDLATNGTNSDWLSERAILSPLNKTVCALNNWLLSEFPGDERLFKSVDYNIKDGEAVIYPVEVLNETELPGLPPHALRLKEGLPVMILRNIAPPVITNGTRCIISRMHHNILEVEVSCGPYKGEKVVLPKIPLEPSKNDIAYRFKRLQFPCKPCFAMTVHKSQGQTFKTVGVDLSQMCFSHGQMYVACSRTGSADSLFMLTRNGQSRNVVFKEVLRV